MSQDEPLLSECQEDGYEDDVKAIRQLVQRIYELHDSSKAHLVDELFDKYDGLERELYERICEKYGLEPDPFYLPAPCEGDEEFEDAYQSEDPYQDAAFGDDDFGVAPNSHREAEVLSSFLAANGFNGVNTKRRRMLTSCYPLHVAVQQNDAINVELLIAAGADTSCRNSLGLTPLQLAQRRNKNGSHAQVLTYIAMSAKAGSRSARGMASPRHNRIGIFKRLTGRGTKGAKERQEQVMESYITQERSIVAEY